MFSTATFHWVYLATLPPGERREFAERVAAALPAPVIDYVRLNIVARR